MKLTISTGVRVATDYPEEGFEVHTFTVDVPDHELDPETVWRAGNRVDSLDGDLAALTEPWQRDVRRALDTHQAPSLSVGDTLALVSDSGTPLIAWRCASSGWTVVV